MQMLNNEKRCYRMTDITTDGDACRCIQAGNE